MIRVFNACLVALVVAGLIGFGAGKFPSLQPAAAQTVRFQATAKQLYQQLPNLPVANQYVSRSTGKAAVENTLARRLMQYHLDVKGRSPIYRLDWKLTLADYLGANESLSKSTYPGYNLLRSNPMEGDRTIISRLNRAQRDALIQALVNVFTANTNQPVQPLPGSSAVTQPNVEPAPQLIPLPKPGDSQLLSP